MVRHERASWRGRRSSADSLRLLVMRLIISRTPRAFTAGFRSDEESCRCAMAAKSVVCEPSATKGPPCRSTSNQALSRSAEQLQVILFICGSGDGSLFADSSWGAAAKISTIFPCWFVLRFEYKVLSCFPRSHDYGGRLILHLCIPVPSSGASAP